MKILSKKLLTTATAGVLAITAVVGLSMTVSSCMYDIHIEKFLMDGSNWSGRISGKLKYLKDEKTKTVIYTGNEGYRAINLIIPDYVIDEKGNSYAVLIGDSMFENNQNIKGRLIISDFIKSIGKNAFFMCSGLNSINFGYKMKNIGDEAFSGCTNLLSVIATGNVSVIGYKSFSDCTNLEYVEIGSNVNSIGELAFTGCSKLKNIKVSNLNKTYTLASNLGDNAFAVIKSNGIKKEFTDNSVVVGSLACGQIIIHQKQVADLAFTGAAGIKSIFIGSETTKIGMESFSGCQGLEKIDVDKTNLKYRISNRFGSGSFVVVDKEGDVTSDSNSLKIIGSLACGDIEINDEVVQPNMFANCAGIKSVSFGNNVRIIESGAFKNVTGLKNIRIGKKVTNIDSEVFLGCTEIKTIGVDILNNKYELSKHVGSKGFVVIEKGNHFLHKIEAAAGLACGDLLIDNGYELHAGAFYQCSSLKSVTTQVGKNVVLEPHTFVECEKLHFVSLGKSIVALSESSFVKCFSLSKISFSSAFTKISALAFEFDNGSSYSHLREIDFSGKPPIFSSISKFSNMSLSGDVIVYKKYPGWKSWLDNSGLNNKNGGWSIIYKNYIS